MNIESLFAYLSLIHIGLLIRSLLLVIIGYFVGRIVSRRISTAFIKRLTPHQLLLLRLTLFYTIFFIFLASAIQQLGFSIGALLGATGILTIAITFASQTTLSNAISGFFIIGEKSFQIGDSIKINDIQGEVLNINLFSIKIRTPDNTLIRIPNEMIIKTPIINISYFPTRRLDLILNINYQVDLRKLEQILLETMRQNTFLLPNTNPLFSILSFNESFIQVQISMWTSKESFQDAKTMLAFEIMKALADHGLKPTQVLNTKYNEPYEVRLLQNEV